jgi:hypothetical protein
MPYLFKNNTIKLLNTTAETIMKRYVSAKAVKNSPRVLITGYLLKSIR